MPSITRALLSMASLVAAPVVFLAQAPPQVLRSSAAAVRVDVLVSDNRRPIRGLTVGNFEVRDNGVVQSIADVQSGALPLNVLCIFDTSGSVEGAPLAHLKTAYLALVDALAGDDRAAVITFSNRVRLHSGFTADRGRLRAVAGEMRPSGPTSVFDAVATALAMPEAENTRTIALLFSDGSDNTSWLTAREAVDAAKRSDVVVYPITLRLPMPTGAPPRVPSFGSVRSLEPMKDITRVSNPSEVFLEQLGDDSGGRVVYAADHAALAPTFLGILEEFRHRYVISYAPSGVAADGWHKLEVKLKGKSGQVRARRGYFAQQVGNPTPVAEPRRPH